MPDPRIPRFQETLLPALEAVSTLGGSGSISEIDARIASASGLSGQQQNMLHKDGPRSGFASAETGG